MPGPTPHSPAPPVPWRLLALVVLTLAFLWLFQFPRELEANADTERDLLRVLALTEHGIWPDVGPSLQHLSITLTPAWYYFAAPALVVAKSPLAVHVLHVLLLLGGVIAYAASVRGMAGVIGATVLASSTWALEVLAKLWHPGALPGLGLLWLAALRGGLSPSPRAGARWLLLGWVTVAFALQCHLASAAFVPGLAVVHALHLRRHRLAGGRWGLAVSAILALATATFVVRVGWLILSDPARQSTAPDAGTSTLALLEMTLGFLGASASSVPGLGLVVALLACVGVARNASKSAQDHVWVLVLLVQVALGLVVAGMLSTIQPAPRYFAGAVVPVFGLMTAGLRALPTQRLPSIARFGVLLLPILLLSRLLFGADTTSRTTAIPTLLEQDAAFGVLTERGATLGDVRRLHGAFANPLTAFRYMAVAAGLPVSGPQRHWLVAPEGFPEPPRLLGRAVVTGAGLRPLVVGAFEPRIVVTNAVVGGRPCRFPLPAHWSALEPPELLPFGLGAGVDFERCKGRTAPDAPLHITVEAQTGEPATLVLAWFDVARNPHSRASVRATAGIHVERLEGEMYRDLAVFRLSSPGGLPPRFDLDLSPLGGLALVDLY